jgi:hypothetical protein
MRISTVYHACYSEPSAHGKKLKIEKRGATSRKKLDTSIEKPVTEPEP